MESKKPKRKRRTKAEMEAVRAKEAEAQKKGLGDAVEAVTKATGIKAFIEYLNGGKPCEGCEKRKAWLNKVGKRRPETMTLDEFKFIESVKDKNRLDASEQIKLYKIHARIYRTPYQVPGNCGSCTKTKRDQLVELYKAYLKEL